MATSTRRTTTSKPAKKATTASTSTATATKKEPVAKVEQPKKKYKPAAFDPNQTVTVRNGFQGRLIYISKKTGELYDFPEFGSEQDMTVEELRNARNSSRAFFENNWFQFDDPELIEYLGVQKYYKYALKIEDFDKLFVKSPEEIEQIVSELSDGQKKSLAYRAKQLIATGDIDSNRVIKALESSLGVALIEREEMPI